MKILITGSNGLLAQKIIFLALKESVNILATSKGVDRSSNFHQIYQQPHQLVWVVYR